ncbi:ATP-binding protein [Candidatus Saccharibacteria bacterium]|nr:ATP-binding protein [Candidatus Saccharibacteria bacterium]
MIEGAKWCGKTTTASQLAKSELRLGRPEELQQAQMLALGGIDTLLEGATPRLIDEWQVLPQIWDAVRSEVDDRGKFGQFIFTGSAVSGDKSKIIHSGVGRFSWVRMRPMSLFESGDSNGEISLKDLFKQKKIREESALLIKDLAYVACRGGFPSSLMARAKQDALVIAADYYSAIIHSDLARLDGVSRSPEYIARLLRSYARFQGEQVALTQVQSDMGGMTGNSPSIGTVTSYHDALKKIFVVEDAPAWNPNLRSKTAIRTSDTRYFVDPSIATAALDVDPEGLFADLNIFGFIFETLCMRDLRVYAEALGGGVSHYRDSNDLECDAVVHIPGGEYGLVQFKLGGSEEEIESAAKLMKNLAEIVDTDRMKKPAFMMVLTGANKYGYRRPDGVYVVPVGCLKD